MCRHHHVTPLTLHTSSFFFFFQRSADHRDLHSFPTRRSSDLRYPLDLLAQWWHDALPPQPLHAPRDRHEGKSEGARAEDRKSTRLNSSHQIISYAVFCLKKKKKTTKQSSNKKNTYYKSNKNMY